MARGMRLLVALAGAVTLTAFLLGTAFAQTAPVPGSGANYGQTFLDRLAAALGIDRARLDAAAQRAGNEVIDQALKDGAVTQAQADRMRRRVAQGAWPMHPFFGRHGYGFFHGGRGPELDAAASALGMTRADLVTELQNGKTIGQVADARGVDRQKVRDAIVAAHKAELDAAVQNGTLTQQQADLMLQLYQTYDPLEKPLGGCRWKTGTGGGTGTGTGAAGAGGAFWRGAARAPSF